MHFRGLGAASAMCAFFKKWAPARHPWKSCVFAIGDLRSDRTMGIVICCGAKWWEDLMDLRGLGAELAIAVLSSSCLKLMCFGDRF